MCGDDPAGVVLAHAVDKTGRQLMDALTNLVNGTARIGDAVTACGANHGNANSSSDINSRNACVIQFPLPTPALAVKYPPTSEGGGGEPFFAKAIESLVGIVCPNGHQDKLRAAATDWRAMSAECTSAAAGLTSPSNAVAMQEITEGEQIGAAITALRDWLTNTAASCTTLAGQLDQYADHLDSVHQALKDLAAKIAKPSSLLKGVVHLFTGGHDGVADDIRTVLHNFKAEADALATLVAADVAALEQVTEGAARYAGIVLYNVAADLVNIVASYGNAIQQDPLRMGIDMATTAAGVATMILGGGGEVLGAGLDLTGIGAVAGVPINIASAGVIAAGAGLTGLGVIDATRDARAHMVTPMASKNPGGGRQVMREPAPGSLKAFPDAKTAKPKTPVQGGGGRRPRWVDGKGKIYEWDYQHKTVEVYSKDGKRHLGEFDPETGVQTKPADRSRSVEK
ncbi:colicin E3/pyocin S6 family cytotoxin [Nocardia sp. NPDC059240]|uniref:colicin E3/pyocin S6 family cytotoxin n=1 Tax=Nocardia sp. NPDC059240 TaxID=3346786 RepID=UPI0036B1A908